VAILSLAGCGEADRAPAGREVVAAATATADDVAHVRRRDDARLVLERHCGACHVSAYDTALPGALAVYDLLEEEWAVRATDLQLRDIVFRLGEPLGPGADALEVTPEERATVERYVDEEIARRAGGAS
jgi:mono/diheme cytochrome c family protein